MPLREMTAHPRALCVVLGLPILSWGCAGRINDELWSRVAEWSYATSVGTIIHESSWLFAVVESFHLVGLALLGGAVLIVDLRLLGLGLRDGSVVELARGVRPWLLCSLTVMLASGLLLYLSEATKFYSAGFYDSAEFPFIYKMLFLAMAILFTFTVRQRTVASESVPIRPVWRKLVALTSIGLWLGVAIAGRGIGFY